MRLEALLETSTTLFLLRILYIYYFSLERKIAGIYHNSYIYSLSNYFIETIRLSLRFSFLKKIFDIIEKGNPVFLYNSRFVRSIMNSYEKLRRRMIVYLNTSLGGGWLRNIKKEFSSYSLKALSSILISAVAINLVLSVIFQRKLGIIGLTVNWILLIMAVIGLLCDVNWTTAKKSSIILKILFR